jgi:CHAT domain-containing protein
MGLSRAFMYAGAPTVGVSLWSVADRSTAELMTDFYRRLLTTNDASSSSALRGAQLAMIPARSTVHHFSGRRLFLSAIGTSGVRVDHRNLQAPGENRTYRMYRTYFTTERLTVVLSQLQRLPS